MQKAPLIWTNILVFSSTFLVALVAVPWYAIAVGFGKAEIIAMMLCLGYCGMSITAGYHRLWSHKSYQAHPILEFIFAIGGAFALQNSAIHWASDHRVHHRHVDDNDKDPYSAKRGFWFSHIGWMLRDYQGPDHYTYDNVRDLQKNKILRWQHKHYLALVLATNIGIPVLLGLLFGNLWGMILLVGVMRLVLSHHFTFFINSLAHIWGKQTYTDQNTARDNGVLALLTYGEGYHNFHHLFEYDYRNGIKWWHFDPTKWLIKACSWVGLASKLRTCPEERIEQAKAAMQLQHARARLSALPDAEQILHKVELEYELLLERMQAYYELKKSLLMQRKQQLQSSLQEHYAELNIQKQYQELKALFTEQRRHWRRLTTELA
ncbi:acyl-CoA desaturase [Alkalimonas amylolytica]|uniref:Stearoyl-CoA desaturase (Delta-9 desaturase) n=1 Tax=Alkalimonas amylolytica TaxID=152573 RepID=A0A1H4DJR1_ALKAM|nr:fatty acid desaturase [Alkalimonas amylolytica]SEA72786.1 stearoyl-CoA desaturase (delta-9 desaturase) [Alkalimonas amylolytica]